MIPLLLARQQIGRSTAFRLSTRAAALIQDGSSAARPFSTAPMLPPVLPPPSPPQPQAPIHEKGMMGKLMNRYSIQDSQNRIRIAESFFQAATRQGADPYVILFGVILKKSLHWLAHD